mgnify:FL=1
MVAIPMDTTELQLKIKERFRLLVVANGGPTACERIMSFPQSHISEAMSKHRLDRMPRADHISILEAACGQLIVTSFMTDLQGYDIELREHKASDLGNALAHMLKETGEASSCAALALAKGQMDEVTRQRNIKELTEARDALEEVITAMRAA